MDDDEDYASQAIPSSQVEDGGHGALPSAAAELDEGYEHPDAANQAEAANGQSLNFVEDDGGDDGAAAELPYWKCEYCNVHTASAVVKCCATGKWFCNYKPPGLPASCIVYHMVRSKHNEVMLHKESPLGEITLECFLTGAKNIFQLG